MVAFLRQKKCPILTRGRAQHAAFGVLATAVPGWIAHSMLAAGLGLLFAWVFAIAWEFSTPILAKTWFRKWAHPWGDVIDLMAYVVGGSLAMIALGELVL